MRDGCGIEPPWRGGGEREREWEWEREREQDRVEHGGEAKCELLPLW
jgi:hypothetical protein